MAGDDVGGLLLCTVGPHRLAFAAGEVTTIGAASLDHTFPSARKAYALPAAAGRVLVSEDGSAVTVDTLEVHGEPSPLLPAPRILVGNAGGSLTGFVSARDALWPVLRLSAFARYLAGLGRR